jgi:hypothetical protein
VICNLKTIHWHISSKNIQRHSQQEEGKEMQRYKIRYFFLYPVMEKNMYLGVAAITSLTVHITRFGTVADIGLSS